VRIGRFEEGEAELRHLRTTRRSASATPGAKSGHQLPAAGALSRGASPRLHRLRAERGRPWPRRQGDRDGECSGGAGDFPPQLGRSRCTHERSDWMLLRSIAEETV